MKVVFVDYDLVWLYHFNKLVDFADALTCEGWFANVERCCDGVPLLTVHKKDLVIPK